MAPQRPILWIDGPRPMALGRLGAVLSLLLAAGHGPGATAKEREAPVRRGSRERGPRAAALSSPSRGLVSTPSIHGCGGERMGRSPGSRGDGIAEARSSPHGSRTSANAQSMARAHIGEL